MRIGDTVRRPVRSTSPATCALLEHLACVGFDGAPRYLVTDAQGREVLTYVPGYAVALPYPDRALGEVALRSVADLLRALHDAVEGLDPGPHVWPGPVPARFRTPLVTHNDPNLDNVVFRDGRAAALIDLDLASPGSRVWEVAEAARLWAPLRTAADVDDRRHGRSLERLRTFVDAYGLDPAERGLLPQAVLATDDWIYGLVSDEACRGHEAFGEYWREDASDRARWTRDWYLRDRDDLAAAVA